MSSLICWITSTSGSSTTRSSPGTLGLAFFTKASLLEAGKRSPKLFTNPRHGGAVRHVAPRGSMRKAGSRCQGAGWISSGSLSGEFLYFLHNVACGDSKAVQQHR